MARSKNEIRDASGLPDWFSLAKYKDARNLDAKDWYFQLKPRIYTANKISFRKSLNYLQATCPTEGEITKNYIYEVASKAWAKLQFNSLRAEEIRAELEALQLESRKSYYDGSVRLSEIDESDAEWIANTRKNPLSQPEDPRGAYIFYANDKPAVHRTSLDDEDMIGVRDFTFQDTVDLMGMLSKGKLRHLQKVDSFSRRWKAQYKNRPPITQMPARQEWMDDLLIDHRDIDFRTTPVMVDLRIQDKLLIDAFSEWLKSARKSSAYYHSHTFSKWCDYQILAYFDLLIWEIETDKKITQSVYTKALNLGTHKTEKNFQTTTLKLAQEMLKGSILKDLQSQIAHEASICSLNR